MEAKTGLLVGVFVGKRSWSAAVSTRASGKRLCDSDTNRLLGSQSIFPP